MEAADYHKLGEAVLARRRQIGLSQAEVERRGGPSELTIRKIENDQLDGPPRLQTLQKLEQALGWKPGIARGIAHGTAGDDPDAWVISHAVSGVASIGLSAAAAAQISQTMGWHVLRRKPGGAETDIEFAVPDLLVQMDIPQLTQRAVLMSEFMNKARVEHVDGDDVVHVSVEPDLWRRMQAAIGEPIDMQKVATAVAELWQRPSTPEVEQAKAALVKLLHQAVEVQQAIEVESAGAITPRHSENEESG